MVDQFMVNDGDVFMVLVVGLLGGIFFYYFYFEVDDDGGGFCIICIFFECLFNVWLGLDDDFNVLGKIFGNFIVFFYISNGENQECDFDDIEQDWYVGGNLVGLMNKQLGICNVEDMIFISSDVDRGIFICDGFFGFGIIVLLVCFDVSGKIYFNDNSNIFCLLGIDYVFVEFFLQGEGVGF